ncbi:MAG: hypothetical protein AB2401_14260 [Bacillus sp. (in: firmicutes)]
MKISESVVGRHDGQTIVAHTIENAAGMQVTSINYGCTITKIVAPDKSGNLENIVLGFDTSSEDMLAGLLKVVLNLTESPMN